MKRAIVSGAILASGFVGSPQAHSGARPVELRESKMMIEYTVDSTDAAIVVSTEAETHLARVEVRNPLGQPVLEVRSERGSEFGFQGFVVDSGESTPTELFAEYPPGDYTIRARTTDGRTAVGTARFSHALPRPPRVLYPSNGMVDVPTTDLEVSWTADAAVDSYRVSLEQHETDVMTVIVRSGTGSFQVPDGVLESGTRSRLEIGAIGADGNCTVVQVPFLTR